MGRILGTAGYSVTAKQNDSLEEMRDLWDFFLFLTENKQEITSKKCKRFTLLIKTETAFEEVNSYSCAGNKCYLVLWW